MYLYGHKRMIYGHEHIIISAYAIHIKKAIADLHVESKYRKVCCLFAYKQVSGDILKGKTQNFEFL